MKRILNILIISVILIFAQNIIAQNPFTVKVPETDDCSSYLKPLKPGASHQFQVSVKNNTEKTYTVSFDKDPLVLLGSWVSISDNEQSIIPDQTVTFLLTIKIPSDAMETNYGLDLYFNAYDTANNNNPFSYYTQSVIVDKSKPNAPTISTSSKSNEIFVSSWESWDARSSQYYCSGFNGIETYRVVLKYSDGSVKDSKTKNATDYHNHNFTNLQPNTTYKISVTATDLAGNTNTTEITTKTAPTAPTGLVFSQTDYISSRLSWNTSPGATGYNVYSSPSNTQLNSSPITSNSFLIENLAPNTTAKFYVKALSDYGSSDNSAIVTVTTLPLPIISGSDILCSGNSTYSISSLASGYTISWSCSSNLRLLSQSGTSAVFRITSSGLGNISAGITSPRGQVLNLSQRELWIGKPDVNTINLMSHSHSLTPPITVDLNSTHSYYASLNGPNDHGDFKWMVWGGTPNHLTGPYNIINYTLLGRSIINLSRENVCGESEYKTYIINVKDGTNCPGCPDPIGGFKSTKVNDWGMNIYKPLDGVLNLFPNPVTDNLTVSINTESIDSNRNFTKKSIQDYEIIISNNLGIIVYENSNYQQEFSIDVKDWTKGIYYLKLMIDNKLYNKSFIVR